MSNLQSDVAQNSFPDSSGLVVRIPGNSGCRVEVLHGVRPAIRKTSDSSHYQERLQKQRIKQQSCRPDVPGIVVPKIISFDEHSFTMEYLQMLDAIEFFERASPAAIQKRFKVIIDFIQWELRSVDWQKIPHTFLLGKLENIRSNVPLLAWTQYYAGITSELQVRLTRPLHIPLGSCHGDLTFSNILFAQDENQVGLIDFLDSFIETPLLDLVKLRQDTRFHWTITRYPRPHDQGKVRLVNRWLDTLIDGTFSALIQSSTFVCLEIINYLRIAPYVSSSHDHAYLSAVLKDLSLQLEVYPCI